MLKCFKKKLHVPLHVYYTNQTTSPPVFYSLHHVHVLINYLVPSMAIVFYGWAFQGMQICISLQL